MKTIQDIKEVIDILSVIKAAGVELTRQGSKHVGLCPFHADKEPSFVVYPDGFHCFGCGAHGDAIDFIQKLHGCDFKDALRILRIDRGRLAPHELERIRRRREAIRAFRAWEKAAIDYNRILCRCAGKILSNIKTEADLEEYGDLYHALEMWECHFNVLTGDDDQAKLEMFSAGTYTV